MICPSRTILLPLDLQDKKDFFALLPNLVLKFGLILEVYPSVSSFIVLEFFTECQTSKPGVLTKVHSNVRVQGYQINHTEMNHWSA